jgi:hypothetical protein
MLSILEKSWDFRFSKKFFRVFENSHLIDTTSGICNWNSISVFENPHLIDTTSGICNWNNISEMTL